VRELFPFSVHPVSGAAIHLGFVKAGQPAGPPGNGEVPNHEPDFAEGPEPEDVSSGGAAVPACPPELARWLDRVDEVLIYQQFPRRESSPSLFHSHGFQMRKNAAGASSGTRYGLVALVT
jgi:hypothetical protein